MHRVLGVEEPPHHVLHAVGVLEVLHQHVPVGSLLQHAVEDLLLLAAREVDVLDEHVGGDDRVEARALAEDGGVVADAFDE